MKNNENFQNTNTLFFYIEFNEKSFQNTGSFFWCKENENLIKMLTVYIHSYKQKKMRFTHDYELTVGMCG